MLPLCTHICQYPAARAKNLAFPNLSKRSSILERGIRSEYSKHDSVHKNASYTISLPDQNYKDYVKVAWPPSCCILLNWSAISCLATWGILCAACLFGSESHSLHSLSSKENTVWWTVSSRALCFCDRCRSALHNDLHCLAFSSTLASPCYPWQNMSIFHLTQWKPHFKGVSLSGKINPIHLVGTS